MRGKKTSFLEPLKPLIFFFIKNGIREFSYGYIRSVKGRRDARIDIKVKKESGSCLLSCTTKHYHQNIRIYHIDFYFLIELLKSFKKREKNFRIRF